MTAAVEACALVRELESLLEALSDKIARAEACKFNGDHGDGAQQPNHFLQSMLGSSLALKVGAHPHPYHAHHIRQQQQQRWQQQQQPPSPPFKLQETLRTHLPQEYAPSSESTFLALTGHHHDAPPNWSSPTSSPEPPSASAPPATRLPLASVKEALENLKRIESSAAATKATQKMTAK
jgi:hypothetical protein